jgi:hypothetical protein
MQRLLPAERRRFLGVCRAAYQALRCTAKAQRLLSLLRSACCGAIQGICSGPCAFRAGQRGEAPRSPRVICTSEMSVFIYARNEYLHITHATKKYELIPCVCLPRSPAGQDSSIPAVGYCSLLPPTLAPDGTYALPTGRDFLAATTRSDAGRRDGVPSPSRLHFTCLAFALSPSISFFLSRSLAHSLPES